MNQIKALHYKSVLLGYGRELEQAAGKTTLDMKTGEKLFSDPLDRASSELDRDVELLISNRHYAVLQEIRAAITRINHGVYGICERCGEAITEKRLRVNPISRLCIGCQSLEERRIKSASGNFANIRI